MRVLQELIGREREKCFRLDVRIKKDED